MLYCMFYTLSSLSAVVVGLLRPVVVIAIVIEIVTIKLVAVGVPESQHSETYHSFLTWTNSSSYVGPLQGDPGVQIVRWPAPWPLTSRLQLSLFRYCDVPARAAAASHSHSHPRKMDPISVLWRKGRSGTVSQWILEGAFCWLTWGQKCPQTSPRLIKFHCLSDFLYALMKISLLGLHMVYGVDKNPLCIQDAACEDLSDMQFSFPKPCSTMFMSPWHLNLWTTAQTMQESFNINPGLFAMTSWIIRSYNLIESVHMSFNSSHGCHIISRNFMPRSSSPCFYLLWSKKTCRVMPGHSGASTVFHQAALHTALPTPAVCPETARLWSTGWWFHQDITDSY